MHRVRRNELYRQFSEQNFSTPKCRLFISANVISEAKTRFFHFFGKPQSYDLMGRLTTSDGP
jgi:hypothetical protein